MTAIQGFVKPTRRPGELGVHSLDHFHFVVPDLAAAKTFYDEFGLEVGERGSALTLATKGGPHVWGTIGEGPRKKHQYVSFGIFEDDLDRFAERFQTLGVKRVDRPAGVEFERDLDPRPRRQPGRNRGRAEDVAQREERVRPAVRGAAPSRRAEPQRRRTHPSPPARAYVDVHHGRDEGHRILFEGAWAPAFRPFRRRHSVHARHARQRSPHDCARQVERARHAPPELGRGQRR